MELPTDTKAYNNAVRRQSRPLGSNREPMWGKNADTPYWERERGCPSYPRYSNDWRKSEDLSTENAPGLASYQQPFYDPNGRNVVSLPGEIAAMDTQGVGEGMHIWQRMAVLVRFRRIDMIEIMHARDPKDCNIFEQTQFERALADCFGPAWTELAMTAPEFTEVTAPYKTRQPTGPGQPPAMIKYRSFCYDLQKYAEEHLSDAEISHAFALKWQQPAKTRASLR